MESPPYARLRAAVDAVRDPFHIVLNYGAAAAAALGLGLLYRDAGYETAGMQDRLGAFFFLLVFVSLLTMGSVPSWHGSRRVFLHERASSVYGTTERMADWLVCYVCGTQRKPHGTASTSRDTD